MAGAEGLKGDCFSSEAFLADFFLASIWPPLNPFLLVVSPSHLTRCVHCNQPNALPPADVHCCICYHSSQTTHPRIKCSHHSFFFVYLLSFKRCTGTLLENFHLKHNTVPWTASRKISLYLKRTNIHFADICIISLTKVVRWSIALLFILRKASSMLTRL